MVQHIRTSVEPGSKDASAGTGLATSDPGSYASLRASYDIAPNHSVDLMLRHVGKLDSPAVPAYSALDLNYIWQVRPNLDLSLAGYNLLDARHAEFGAAPNRSAYRRRVGVKLVWRL